jgi:hypothetical protein
MTNSYFMCSSSHLHLLDSHVLYVTISVSSTVSQEDIVSEVWMAPSHILFILFSTYYTDCFIDRGFYFVEILLVLLFGTVVFRGSFSIGSRWMHNLGDEMYITFQPYLQRKLWWWLWIVKSIFLGSGVWLAGLFKHGQSIFQGPRKLIGWKQHISGTTRTIF